MTTPKSNPILGRPKTSCFAHRDGECMAIEPARCAICRFYKTREQNETQQQRVYAQIAAKPLEEQRYIADRYYQRKMPWKGAGRHDQQRTLTAVLPEPRDCGTTAADG